MDDSRSVDGLSELVADGDSIDWRTLDSEACDEDARDLIEQLQIIADVAIAHRAIEDPPTSTTRETVGVVPPAAEPTLRRWGPYELVEELGHGTFGRVYRAWDPDLERFVAVKLHRPIDALPEASKDRVLREGRAIAKVSHPNIVAVHGVGVHDSQVGLCMELVNGRTLDTIVRTQGTLSAQEASTIGRSVCNALSAMHAASLVHRDVKARNVMRDERGRIVLMDFGTGEVLRDEAEARAGIPQGTPIYMPPEALAGAPGSVAADIYSTGVLLYFLVTGRYPYEGASSREVKQAHARGERHFITEHRPDLPLAFVRAVEKALDPAPQRRQRSASQLAYELSEVNELVQPEPGRPPQVQPFAPRNVSGALAIAILATLFGLGFFNSFAYSRALGLEESGTPIEWLVWGIRSMVAPLFVMIPVSLVVLIFAEIVPLVRRVSPVTDQRLRVAGDVFEVCIRRFGLTPSSALACALIPLSLLFDWWVVARRFPDLVNAMLTPIAIATPEMLARLGPANYDEQVAYRQVLSLGALAMVFGLVKMSQMASRRGESVRPLRFAAAVTTTLFTIVLLDVPYRILWQNDSERVVYKDATCYVIASKGESVRLFCGTRTPRSIVVDVNDPDLARSQTTENIFTPFSELAQR